MTVQYALRRFLNPVWPASDTRLSTNPPNDPPNVLHFVDSASIDVDFLWHIQGVPYIATGASPLQLDNGDLPTEDGSLVTVARAQCGSPIDAIWFKSYLGKLSACDVYRRDAFLQGVIVTNIQREQAMTSDCRDYLKGFGNKWIDLRTKDDPTHTLPPGPYLLINNTLKPVRRLYDDVQGTILTALRPKLFPYVFQMIQLMTSCSFDKSSDSPEFSQLTAVGTSYDCLAFAVPPRSPENANGVPPRLRILVKDIYRIHGLKTSLCNKAYYEISDVSTSTAPVIQLLIKDGAHILGMAKLSTMIAREEPMDAVEYPAAFNPRGDGYQSPAGSSSGSAAAVASYDWLDCSIGSDSTGSGRRPALVNGVWQFRPSHDLIDREGMVPTCARFDTPCVFSRHLPMLKSVLRSWLEKDELEGPSGQPYNVIYPIDYLPVDNSAQMGLIEKFLDDMSTHLCATVTKFSIRNEWKSSHPDGTTNDVDAYLEDVITRTFYYDFYHSTDKFREDYMESHDGRLPYVIPFVQKRQAKGAAVTQAENEDAMQRLEVYRRWLHKTLFSEEGKKSVIILPIANAEPNYRDEPSQSPEEQSALDQLFVSPILKSPDIMVPIGDVPYQSRITDRTEFLPVLVNIVGAPGTDFELLEDVEKLMSLSGRRTSVSTGSRMFPQP